MKFLISSMLVHYVMAYCLIMRSVDLGVIDRPGTRIVIYAQAQLICTDNASCVS
jgi:hypothetical protein